MAKALAFRILPSHKRKHNIYYYCHQSRSSYYWLQTLQELIVNVLDVKSLCIMSWDVSKLKSNLTSVISKDLQTFNFNILNKTHEQIATSDVGSYIPQSDKTPINKCFAWSGLNSNKRKLLDTLNTRNEKIMKMERFVGENEVMEESQFPSGEIQKDDDDFHKEAIKWKEKCEKAITQISRVTLENDKEMYRSNVKDEHVKQKQSASSPEKERIKSKQTILLKDNMNLDSNNRAPFSHPTHCLVVRITNTSVHKKVAALKTAVESMNPDFVPCFVKIPALHIPLVVMTLDNLADIQQVYNTLERSLFEITELTSAASKIYIEFISLGNFQGKVVFLNIKKNKGLNYFKKVRKLLSNSLRTLNINVKQEQFKRGVAIMKLNNCFPLIDKGINKIPTNLYEVYKDDYFGEQELNEILLCSMPTKKESVKCYNILASMNLMEAKLYLTDGEIGNDIEQKSDQVHIPYQNEVEEMIIDDCDNKIVVMKKYEHSISEKPQLGDGKNIDEIKMTSKFSKEKKKKEKSKHLWDRTNSSEQYDVSKSNHFKSNKTSVKTIPASRHTRPTHFLAFRLRNHIIHEKATELQEAIANINKDFKSTFVKIPTLHITLAVMALNNEEEIDNAIKALDLSLNRLNDVYNKALCKFIEFDSLGTFNGKVLFIDVKKTEGLQLLKSIVPILKDALLEQNIVMSREMFTPHVTILKLSKSFSLLKKKGIKEIPADMYHAQKNDYFGKEELIEILLCSMSGKKNDDGFYKILASINLKNYKVTRSDTKTLGTSNLSLQNVIAEKRQPIENKGNMLKMHEKRELNGMQSINGLDKSFDVLLYSAQKQKECCEDTVITIFPEREDTWEIIDPNYLTYLYGNIFVRICFHIYKFLLEFFLKALHRE